MSFHGSYQADDVTFLLKPVRLAPTEIAEKERLIQSGRRHYSEMISPERLPSPAYLRIFHQALAREKQRFARDLLLLARHIAAIRPRGATLVSLARAGTPIGVLVAQILRRMTGEPVPHYSISIIRDRGIDVTAVRHILGNHRPDSLVFLDGWTGKGVIARELRHAIGHLNDTLAVGIDDGLYTVADLCGAAAFAATADDYLIPSSVLGATISGLVSRSILNSEIIGPDDFHGCLYLEEFATHDLSRWFVEEVFAEIDRQWESPCADRASALPHEQLQLQEKSRAFVADIRSRFGIAQVNHIKPGIGEATRVLLRRVPDCLLVRDANADQVAHLLLLAEEKHVPIVVDAAFPYAAAALIKELDP
jgi:hypothetical protein